MHLLRPGEKPPSREAVIAKLKYAHSRTQPHHTHARTHTYTTTTGNVLAGERFFYRLHLPACVPACVRVCARREYLKPLEVGTWQDGGGGEGADGHRVLHVDKPSSKAD